MDGISMSNESLWSILSGTSVVYSNTIVGKQLEEGKDKFSKGILYYAKSSDDDKGKTSKTSSTGSSAQKDFLSKIMKLIDVSEPVAEELLYSYLVSEFRGTSRSLSALLSSERHQQALLVSVWRFYHTERLYLLMGLRQIIARHADTDHPYKPLFAKFLNYVIDKDGRLLPSLLDQLEWCVSAQPPSWRHNEALSSPAGRDSWVSSALKEQAELLQCVLTYCQQRQPLNRSQLLRLVNLFTRHALGHSPPYAQLLTEQHAELLRSVTLLQTTVCLHGMQLGQLADQVRGSPLLETHLLSTEMARAELDAALPLGARPEHGPLLLAWLLVLHVTANGAAGSEGRRAALTRRCRQLNVLGYIRQMLTEAEVFQNRTSMIGKIARATIYNVVDLLLLCFDATNLGDEKDMVTICAEVLSVPHLAADFWAADSDSCGLRLLFDDVAARFPADAAPLLELCAGLARAGVSSLTEVVSYLQRVPCFAEPAAAVPGGSAAVSQGGRLWSLRAPRRPEQRLPQLLIPAGTEGRLLEGRHHLVSWSVAHSGWQRALIFLDDLHQEGQLGEQHVQPETLERAGAVACLLRAAMETGSPDLLRQLRPHIDLLFPILERHYRWGSPPQSFVHHAAEVLALYARVEPHYVWEHMDRNRLLPRGGAGGDPVLSVEAGRLGELIEAHECVQRKYPLTQAFLHLLHNTVQAAPDPPPAALVPAVAFVLRDVFPAHVRWQYARRGDETALGRACLRLLDALLPLDGPGPLRQMVARALTDGPPAETLLALVVHGEARIVMLLEEQTHWDTGAGLEFIRLIHVALSVLNRLLVLRCREDLPQQQQQQQQASLLETLLTSQPVGRGQLRPVLAIAQYLFHRHNPHLPTLAIRLLLRLAKVFPMSLLASFGQDSDVICSVILRRLRAETEDASLKVAVLDFLATCVTSQPGLLQRLLGVGTVESEDGTKKKAEQDDEGGFLEELLAIFEEHRKSERWESPLLLAAAALVHALWLGQCGAALTHLTASERFWSDLVAPLLAAGGARPPPLALSAHLLRTLALQLYYARKPDPRLGTLLGKATEDRGRLLNAWSKLVCDAAGGLSGDLNSSLVLLDGGELAGGSSSEERQEDGASLLLAWRDWCLVAATPGSSVSISAESQQCLLIDLLTSLEHQLSSGAGRPRLVNILAELVMMLTARWNQRCGDAQLRERVWSLLEACSGQFDELPVRARCAILTTALRTQQHGRAAADSDAAGCVRCLPPCCDMLERALVQCEPAEAAAGSERLAGLAALLLRRLLVAPAARRLLTGRPTLTAVLSALGRRLRQGRQPRLCQHLLQAALAAVSEERAAMEAVGLGLAGELGLPLAELRHRLGTDVSDDWRAVWVLTIHLWTHLLRSQRHFFVTDAIDFAAVHCATLCASISQLRTRLQPSDLEETEAAVSFVAGLMSFSAQWRQRHRHSYDTLLSWLKGCVGVCFWYLCRGRIVALLLERPHTLADREELHRVRRLSSTEPEPERPPPQVTAVQNRLVRLSSVCLVALHALSPPLAPLVTEDGLHLDAWEPLVGTSFASPTLDKPGPPPLTFGTLLAGVNVCVRPLTKSDRSSPVVGEARLERRPLLALLHQTLVLVLEQAALLQLRPPPDAAEHPLNLGHLREEVKSFLDSLKRDQRRSLSHSPSARQHHESGGADEARFLELVQHLVNSVLKG
ncbi:nucleoporin NUP188-like [Amphibalanus amphitrite]|uniref:nucleoporin NUP188-like n=1 Tax=Amphibalanus amphitrite TaxID=1232801 RepID=UPI001C91762E|nr:nucleoporin NUP188-like [Amphibalanus amphitrite]